MKNILVTYEAMSGQAISLPKSEIFGSRNVPQVVNNIITNILGVQAVLGAGKYVGLPSISLKIEYAQDEFVQAASVSM
jgi:hypothetical protein